VDLFPTLPNSARWDFSLIPLAMATLISDSNFPFLGCSFCEANFASQVVIASETLQQAIPFALAPPSTSAPDHYIIVSNASDGHRAI
jgi:hypothetical protein